MTEELSEYVVVLGYGPLTRPVLEKIRGRVDYVVVMTDTDLAARLRDRGHPVVDVESVNEEAMDAASVEDALAVVVASESDADDALAVLTVRGANSSVPVTAVASNSENIEKLRRAGADTVISPADIVGKLLAESALTGDDTEELIGKISRRLAQSG